MAAFDYKKNKYVVLGFDGIDISITNDLMEKGLLPNLKKITAKGTIKPFQTINPAQSPAAWATLGTGYSPAIHKVSDFIMLKKGTYTPELSLMQINPKNPLAKPEKMFAPRIPADLFFWNTIKDHGHDAKIIRWPMTFPAEGPAKILSGMGTPDIFGGIGKYTLYTSNPFAAPEEIKGDVLPLSFLENKSQSHLYGPQVNGIFSKSQSKIAVEISLLESNKAVINIEKQEEFMLCEGELSDYITIEFKIGMGQRISCMVQFLLIDSSEDNFALYMSPIHILPDNPIYTISSPPDYANQLKAKVGNYHTLGMAEDTNALRDEIIDEKHFLTMCERILFDAEKILYHELENHSSGFFAFVFDTTDRIQHMFWRYIDAEHPLHGKHAQNLYGKIIERTYIKMDQILGKALKFIDLENDIINIISDHGFGHYRKCVHINRWLIDNGYMVLKDNQKSGSHLYKNVDWTQTKAFAVGFSQIFLNIKGREPQGIVSLEDVDLLKEEISYGLSHWRIQEGDGKALEPIKAVYDTLEIYSEESSKEHGPELIVGTNNGFRFSWQTALGGAPESSIEDNINKWSGDHCIDSSFVPGILAANKEIEKSKVSLYDLAPTILSSFSITPDKKMTGSNFYLPDSQVQTGEKPKSPSNRKEQPHKEELF